MVIGQGVSRAVSRIHEPRFWIIVNMQALLIRIYNWLLYLYPREFRDEFADEMQSVFADSIADAARRGNIALIQVSLKELRDLLRAILREHWQARSKAIMEN